MLANTGINIQFAVMCYKIKVITQCRAKHALYGLEFEKYLCGLFQI